MKKLIVLLLFLTSCKEQPTSDDEKSAVSMLQSLGCSATKHQGKVTISCADGSTGDIPSTPPVSAFYPATPSQEYPSLRLITGDYFMNTVTRNIIQYDQGKIKGIGTILFDGDNCRGNIYLEAATLYGLQIYANQIYPNQSGFAGYQAFRVSVPSVTLNVRSTFSQGACTANVTPALGYPLTALPWNEQVPNEIIPMTLMMEQ